MRICKVPECDTKQYCSTGYCSKHYQQFRKYGKILERSNFDPNEFIIDGDICWIILYNVKNKEVARTRILTTYYKQIRDSKLKWHLGTGGYVIANWSDDNGYQQHIFLHEAIIQLSGQIVQPGEEIDHKDRDPLNNLDDNLRICTNTQNQQNKRKK